MAAATARHETRALLRAHLAAASGARGYRHQTQRCPVCHRLQKLAELSELPPLLAEPPTPHPPRHRLGSPSGTGGEPPTLP
ncbi:DUF6274 family protein [Streptomyces sp. CC228A]|uniref:DUF6274 family protein n=1 Tax=Streptomyces sp. CC228A TaxID=2898186 RepID=UPI001F40C8C3|nr:DUF6274 family protein [Streptomyces sp. CC228A]